MQPNNYPARKRVLIVDDDPAVLDSTSLALERAGYEVETASDGSTGLALAERRRPDVMLLDMMTPKRSGFIVLETLRRLDDFPTRIIMITANEGNRHKEYAEALGVDAYMRKPFYMDELLATIERVLSES